MTVDELFERLTTGPIGLSNRDAAAYVQCNNKVVKMTPLEAADSEGKVSDARLRAALRRLEHAAKGEEVKAKSDN